MQGYFPTISSQNEDWLARHGVLYVNKLKICENRAQSLPFSKWLKYLNVIKKINEVNINVFKILSTKQRRTRLSPRWPEFDSDPAPFLD